MKFFKNIFALIFLLAYYVRTEDSYLIVGAGPVGLFLASRILEKIKDSKVDIWEKRLEFNRRQCIRLPFEIANLFNDKVKTKLWPVENLRKMLFDIPDVEPKLFWKQLGYQHFPRISVGNFQQTLQNFMDSEYSTRFKLIPKEVKDIKDFDDIKDKYKMIFLTFGNTRDMKNFRKDSLFYPKPEKESEKSETIEKSESEKKDNKNKDNEKDGIYLIYRNYIEDVNKIINEDYIRKSVPLDRKVLSKDGLTYSGTNNENRDVQFYTYPDLDNFKFYTRSKKVPENIIESISFPLGLNYKFGRNKEDKAEVKRFETKLNKSEIEVKKIFDEENEWLKEVREDLDPLFEKYEIYIPNSANLHYAPRKHYAYKSITNENINIPNIFAGDSMGGTDYKHGLNLGRGLYCAEKIVELMLKNKDNTKSIIDNYQTYWDDVLASEFEKGIEENLISDNKIFFKYVINGRTVKGTKYDESKFNQYLDEIKEKKRKRLRRLKKLNKK